MPCVGFEPTIPVFERAKTKHDSDPSETVTVIVFINSSYWSDVQIKPWATNVVGMNIKISVVSNLKNLL
jgi:hypothetical protein